MMVRRGLLLVLLALAARPPLTAPCLHTLRLQTYETYWLGTYPDSRILRFSCLALRGFRWTFKFIKVTYENWHKEMEFAKCVSQNYGMNLPSFTPPWIRHSGTLDDDSESENEKANKFSKDFQRQRLTDISWKLDNESHKRIFFTRYRVGERKYCLEDIGAKEVISSNDKGDYFNYFMSNETTHQQILQRITRYLFQIVVSVLHVINVQLSRTLGHGLLTCAKSYVKSAFWRWIDSAPFLK